MDPLHALREQIRRYLRREQPLVALREWVETHEDAAAASDDATFRDLVADVWAALSESDLGELTGDALRARLADALGREAPGRTHPAAAAIQT